MIDDSLLEQLRHKGESADLDFKQAQYPFANGSDYQKAELLKDILAMANAYRDGPGYILIGFKDRTPHPAEVVGISETDHIDDASLQQFVLNKVEPRLEFHYTETMFAGKHVGVIVIPKQRRPFALSRDYGGLRKHTFLVRRGSSTDEASISEVTKMALADAGTLKNAQVELQIDDERNKPLPAAMELSFLRFGDLPDYKQDNRIELGNGIVLPGPMQYVNRRYYRESADYHANYNRLIRVRLSLANHSPFSLSETKLEVTCVTPDGQTVRMMRADALPQEPEASSLTPLFHSKGAIERLQEKVKIDERGPEPVCHVPLGTLRSGEVGRADDDVAVLPSGPGCYTLRIRILAREIPTPIIQEHELAIAGPVHEMNLGDLKSLLRARHLKEDG